MSLKFISIYSQQYRIDCLEVCSYLQFQSNESPQFPFKKMIQSETLCVENVTFRRNHYLKFTTTENNTDFQ